MLRQQARAVNFPWNYCIELSIKILERERRFMSGYDFHPFTKGSGKAGLDLHSTSIQAVAEEITRACRSIRSMKRIQPRPVAAVTGAQARRVR